jgi:hypothetical protein
MRSRAGSPAGALFYAAGALILLGMIAAAPPAGAALTMDNGTLSNPSIAGFVRYRHFNSNGMGQREVFLNTGDLQLLPNGSCCVSGSTNDITYGGAGTWSVTFEYDGTTLKSVATRGTSTVTTTKSGSLGNLNYVALEVRVNHATRRVDLRNVQLFKGATLLGTLWSDSPTSVNVHQRYAAGEDLTSGFKITADMVITGTPQPGDDDAYVQMKVGYVEPPDSDAPIVSNVHLTPGSPLLNGAAEVDANADDSTTGGSNIASASLHLNKDGSSPTQLAMAAADGTFDAVSEDVTETVGPLGQIGVNEVCVRAKDTRDNESGYSAGNPAGHYPCVAFVVSYAFEGFYSPVDNDLVNDARAGQAVPFKWRLTDADGVGISDPTSFVALKSYAVSCDTLGGDIADSVEEYAPGDSGLQYNGEGYWQFNWKTPKSYAATCRAAYVEFNSTQISPVVVFRFKKQ